MNRIASGDFEPSQAMAKSEELAEYDLKNRLHGGVLATMAISYAYLLGVFWLLFYASAPGALVVAVSTFFFLMYIGTPLMLMRIGGHLGPATSFSEFLNGRFETATGRMSGWQVLVQVNTVPVGLALCVTGIGLAIRHSM
ncbi:MAG TPA: hypothetical protein VIL84_01915 [Devosiaceae bacterium]